MAPRSPAPAVPPMSRVCSPPAPFRVTVYTREPPSATLLSAGLAPVCRASSASTEATLAAGAPSLSLMTTTAVLSVIAARRLSLSTTVRVRAPSATALSISGSAIRLLVSPGAKLRVPLAAV